MGNEGAIDQRDQAGRRHGRPRRRDARAGGHDGGGSSSPDMTSGVAGAPRGLVPDHLGADDDIVQVAIQTWVLRSDGRTILVDTGVGNDKTRPAVGAWDHLTRTTREARAGRRQGRRTWTSSSTRHLHVDHVGWNTRLVDGSGCRRFPNATYLMPETDFEYWDPTKQPEHRRRSQRERLRRQRRARHAAGQVQLWAASHAVDANLRLVAAPGHTRCPVSQDPAPAATGRCSPET